MLSEIDIIIPVYNDEENLRYILTYMESKYIINHFSGKPNIIIIDDSPIKGEDSYSPLNIKRYWYGDDRLGYGRSIIHGIGKSRGKYVIIMDADHPPEYIPTIIMLLKAWDMVIGVEEESNIQRKVTGWLCRNILGLKFKHPTCGFIGFRKETLDIISWHMVQSNYDVSHIELLLMCYNNVFSVGEFSFTGHKGKREYDIGRCIRWLYDFLIMTLNNLTVYYS